MHIAIISDIHDSIENLTWAIAEITQRNTVTHAFLLGDYCSPFIITKFLDLHTPITAVWGNNDLDKQQILQNAHKHEHLFVFAKHEFDSITIDDKKYFITHYPELAENAAKSKEYDAVFHGHTHRIKNEKIGEVPIINPGKLFTYPDHVITFGIFNTANGGIEIVMKK